MLDCFLKYGDAAVRLFFLPIESVVARKGLELVRQMTDIPHHTTAHTASGTDRYIRQGTIEGTIAQPCFGWELQGSVW